MVRISRRQFLGAGLASGAMISFPAPALIARGANEKIRIGGIGCGWRGGDLLSKFSQSPDAQVVALADPSSDNLEAKRQKFPNIKGYRDLRNLIDDKNIDAVFVATCNHWHCLAAIWAMQAGKDVYVEKPLAHTPWEGDQVVLAARKYKRICQVGIQQRSDPMQTAIKKFLYEEKALGNIISARVNRYGVRPSIGKRSTPLEIPADVDYDLWCGPAEKRDLYREKFHYDWHWDWNTGCGEMGNWGVHVFDDLKNNILRDQIVLPKKIMGGGARVLYHDAGDTPNVHFVYFETGIIPVVLGLSNIPETPGARSAGKHPGPASGYVAFCEGGRLEGQRGKAKAFDQQGKLIREFKGDTGKDHVQNFIDGIKARDPSILNADVAIGNASSNWCNLANIAYQCGRPYSQKDASQLDGKTEGQWEELIGDTNDLLQKNGLKLESGDFKLSPLLSLDPDRTLFVGDNAEIANQYIKRTYREGFVVPAIE